VRMIRPAGDAGLSAGSWIERHTDRKPICDGLWLAIGVSLDPCRAKRGTGGRANLRYWKTSQLRSSPLLRCSV